MRWATVAEFTVGGQPKGQPRPRAFASGGKARVFDPGTAEAWKSCVAAAAQPFLPASPLDEPIRAILIFRMPRPKTMKGHLSPDWTHPHLGKPDADNLAKAVLDCLTGIGMWRDDSLVCALYIEKRYCEPGESPGAVIQIMHEEE